MHDEDWSDDPMHQAWPAATPRHEMISRVAARGTRIRAVRGAVNALLVLSVVGASAFGVSAALGSLDSQGGTEVETVALPPDPPELESVSSSSATGVTVDGPTTSSGSSSDTTDSAGTGSSTTSDDGVTTTSRGTGTGAGTGSGNGAGTSGVGSGPSSTNPDSSDTRPSAPATTVGSASGDPSTTVAPTTSAVDAPELNNLRMKADGVAVGLSVCENESESVLSVEISHAREATMSWNRAGTTRSVLMKAGGNSEWSAELGEIDDTASNIPVLVTIEAIGPGGVTRTSVAIEVADCTPLPSDPPAGS